MYFLLSIVTVPIIVVDACIFVQTTTVRMQKLEIGHEQNLHEGRPYLAQPLPPTHVTFLSLFDKTLSPCRKGTSFLNDPITKSLKQLFY